MALFCQMASEEPWCFLEHSGTVLRDGMIIFPGIAAKIAPGHIKDWDGGFRYTMWGSPKLAPQFCKQEVHCSAKEGVYSSRKQSPFVRQNFGMSPMTLEATAVLTWSWSYPTSPNHGCLSQGKGWQFGGFRCKVVLQLFATFHGSAWHVTPSPCHSLPPGLPAASLQKPKSKGPSSMSALQRQGRLSWSVLLLQWKPTSQQIAPVTGGVT